MTKALCHKISWDLPLTSCTTSGQEQNIWYHSSQVVQIIWIHSLQFLSYVSIGLWSCAVEKCHRKVRRPDLLLWSHPWLAGSHHRPLVCPQPPCYTIKGMEEMLSEDPSTSDSLQFSFYSDPGSLVRILGRIWTAAIVFSFVIYLNFYFKNENNLPENLHLKFKSDQLHSNRCHLGKFYSVFFIREQSTQFYLELHGSKVLGMEKAFSFPLSSGSGPGGFKDVCEAALGYGYLYSLERIGNNLRMP